MPQSFSTSAAISLPRDERIALHTSLPTLPARPWRLEASTMAIVALVCGAHPGLSLPVMGAWMIGSLLRSAAMARAERAFILKVAALAERAEHMLPAGHPCPRVLRRYQGMLHRLLFEPPPRADLRALMVRAELVQRIARRCQHVESLLPQLCSSALAGRNDVFTPGPAKAPLAPLAQRARHRRQQNRRLDGYRMRFSRLS